MSEFADKFCGCRYVRPGRATPGGHWWQVVACPDHVFNPEPMDEVPD